LEYFKYLNNNDGINDSFYEEFSNSSIFCDWVVDTPQLSNIVVIPQIMKLKS